MRITFLGASRRVTAALAFATWLRADRGWTATMPEPGQSVLLRAPVGATHDFHCIITFRPGLWIYANPVRRQLS